MSRVFGVVVVLALVGVSRVALAECESLKDGFAQRYIASFKASDAVGFGDVVADYAKTAAACEDEVSAKEKQAMLAAIARAPGAKSGKKSPKLNRFVDKVLARKDQRVTDQIEVASAVALGAKKRLVNEYGVPMGTTQRVSIVVRVKETKACFELRGDLRNSTLQEDQDDPEYIVLERMRGGALGWRNLSYFDFDDLTPAWSVACPKK